MKESRESAAQALERGVHLPELDASVAFGIGRTVDLAKEPVGIEPVTAGLSLVRTDDEDAALAVGGPDAPADLEAVLALPRTPVY